MDSSTPSNVKARSFIVSSVMMVFILSSSCIGATPVRQTETCSASGSCASVDDDSMAIIQNKMHVQSANHATANAFSARVLTQAMLEPMHMQDEDATEDGEKESSGGCKSKCYSYAKEWSKKCNWRNCKECPECFPTTAPPTPTPPPGEYVPGEAGAPWSTEEALIVKAKILALFDGGKTLIQSFLKEWEEKHGRPYECATGPHWNETCGVWPTECKKDICKTDPTPPYKNMPAKMLRLGFHDCFKYHDGSGGCDGCMQFGNMFTTMSQTNSIEKRIWPDTSVGGQHNGLQLPADYLEEVYNNPSFPNNAPRLSTALSASGKSRADLWAFAAMVGAEFGELDNNMACADLPDRTRPDTKHLYNSIGQEKTCVLTQQNPPRFFTGRKDCPLSKRPTDPNTSSLVPHVARSYETEKVERQADAYWNGTDVANYFRTDFNLTRRETVALMGAHSYGGFNFGNSGFKYTWQWAQSHLMNNNYYRLLAAKPSKFLTVDPWIAVGGLNNTNAETGWWLRYLQETTSGGSFLWFHYYRRCPSCLKENGKWKSYEGRGGTYFQSDDCCKCNDWVDGTEPDFDPECFINVTRDETAIHADLALYYQFKVTGTKGFMLDYDSCPGLKPQDWTAERLVDASLDDKGPLAGGIHSWDMPPHCTKNQEKDDEEGSKTMAEMVEEYADDQDAWLADFDRSFEKMLINGYTESELTLGPAVIGLGKTECTKQGRQKDSNGIWYKPIVCKQVDNGPQDGISHLVLLERSASIGLNSDVSL